MPDLKQGIATFYDESSGLWEEMWGEHMHHGGQAKPPVTPASTASKDSLINACGGACLLFMNAGYYPKDSAPKSNQQAQIDMIEMSLQHAGVTSISSVRRHGSRTYDFERYNHNGFSLEM